MRQGDAAEVRWARVDCDEPRHKMTILLSIIYIYYIKHDHDYSGLAWEVEGSRVYFVDGRLAIKFSKGRTWSLTITILTIISFQKESSKVGKYVEIYF